MREGLLNVTGPPEQLTWQVIDASQFSGPEDLVDAVVKERCWVAVTSELLLANFNYIPDQPAS